MKISIKFLLILFFISFLVRLIFSLSTGQLLNKNTFDDEGKYHQMASALALDHEFKLHGYKTAWSGPGFPFVVSIIYRIWGCEISYGRFLNIIIGSLIPVVIFIIAIKIWDAKITIISSFYVAFYPALIFWNQYLLTEPLFSLALISTTGFIFYLQKKLSIINSVILGILIGVTSYIRPVGILFIFYFVIWFFIYFNDKLNFRIQFFKLFLILLTFFIVLLPWMIRNYVVFNKIIPMNTNGGVNLLQGNNPVAWDDNNPMKGALVFYANPKLKEFFPEPHGLLPMERREILLDSIASYKAKHFIKQNYKKIPNISIHKIIKLFKIYPYGSNHSVRIIMFISYGILLPFIIIGMLKILWTKNLLFLMIPTLSTITSSIIFYGMPRLRLPIEPLLILYGIFGIFITYSWINKKYSFSK